MKKLTPGEQKTLQYYNQYGRQWAQGKTKFDWKDDFEQFRKYLPKGKVLEIGSGGGRDAKFIIGAGYDYVGTDISEGLLKIARENNPGATFYQKSVYDLDFPENSLDGFWAIAVLLHIPKTRIDEALQNIHKVIKADGIGVIALKQGEGESMENPPEGGERFFAYYNLEEFKNILSKNNFKILSSRIWPKNERTTWLIYFVKVVK